MNKKLIMFTIVTTVAMIQAANAMPENEVCFKNAAITGFTNYTRTITDGQSFGNIEIENKSDRGCLNIYADRKNDQKNVAWVKQNMANVGALWDSNHMVTTVKSSLGEDTPNSLNFAVKGTLFIILNNVEYQCENFQVGQGHFGGGNNWWVFNNHDILEKTDRWSLKCNIVNTKNNVLLYPATGYANNLFEINLKAPDKNPGQVDGGGGA